MKKLSYENIVGCKEMSYYRLTILKSFFQISPIVKNNALMFSSVTVTEKETYRIKLGNCVKF